MSLSGSAKIAWAVGKPGVLFTASSTHDGIGEYVNINLLTGAANAAVPFNMNAPMLAFGAIFALVIGAFII